MKLDSSIDKYEARLVIKEYKKKESLNYFDIYSCDKDKLYKDDAANRY